MTSKEQKKKDPKDETHCENFAKRIAPCYLITFPREQLHRFGDNNLVVNKKQEYIPNV